MRKKDLELLLAEELAVLERELDLQSCGVHIHREGPHLFVAFERGRDGRPGIFKIDCIGFDAQPPSVSMVNPFTHEDLPMPLWTAGVPHSIHPLSKKPFVCLQGIAEYHNHPSHIEDSWDRYRHRFRIPQTVLGLLRKAGVLR